MPEVVKVSAIGPVSKFLPAWADTVGKAIARIDTEQVVAGYYDRLIVRFTDGTAIMFRPTGEDGSLPEPSGLAPNDGWSEREELVFFGLASREDYERDLNAKAEARQRRDADAERQTYLRLKAKFEGAP